MAAKVILVPTRKLNSKGCTSSDWLVVRHERGRRTVLGDGSNSTQPVRIPLFEQGKIKALNSTASPSLRQALEERDDQCSAEPTRVLFSSRSLKEPCEGINALQSGTWLGHIGVGLRMKGLGRVRQTHHSQRCRLNGIRTKSPLLKVQEMEPRGAST